MQGLRDMIYIPLCLYQYRSTQANVRRRTNLHSTLFILVPSGNTCNVIIRTSTFHSVYISTISSSFSFIPFAVSTFHSVYISTNAIRDSINYLQNLHSTLFILVPGHEDYLAEFASNLHSTLFILVRRSICQRLRRSDIYIPLCLYQYNA